MSENEKWLLSLVVLLGFEVYALSAIGEMLSNQKVQTFNPVCDRAV